jgi:hypothetical protein
MGTIPRECSTAHPGQLSRRLCAMALALLTVCAYALAQSAPAPIARQSVSPVIAEGTPNVPCGGVTLPC